MEIKLRRKLRMYDFARERHYSYVPIAPYLLWSKELCKRTTGNSC